MSDKSLDRIINFGSYKPKYLLVRIIVSSSIASLMIYFVELIADDRIVESQLWRVYLFAIIVFNGLTELNILLMRLMSNTRWKRSLYIQFSILLLGSILAVFLVAFLGEKVFGDENILKHDVTKIALIIGWLVIVIHLLMIVISKMAREWMDNRREINELKQAKLVNDYNSLKDRLNPHFLFNNLSTLKSLIRYDPEIAEKFTQNFTNVYRYVLKSHEETTVSLEQELRFLESYIALHKERIGEGLAVDIRVDPADLHKNLPPMALQLLVENAIKHNIANKQHPLKIEIISEGSSLCVQNNLNRRASTYSTSTGLAAIKSQYKLLVDSEVIIEEDEQFFCVILPLV